MKYVAVAAAFLATLVLAGAAAALIVLVLAGPHSDLLPQPFGVIVPLVCLAGVIALPVLAARAVWRRFGARVDT